MFCQITIIIPTFNNTKGLKYLLNYFKDKDFPLIIVDNQPSIEKQQSVNFLIRNSSINLKYLPQEKNLGFAASVNLGAKYAKTKWMLILNDDIEFLKENTIDQLIKKAESKKMVAVSPVLKNPDGRVENYGYKVLPYGKIELITKLTNSRINELDGLTAACLLIKTAVFKKLKGFDESFFAYLEDIDFFLRLTELKKTGVEEKGIPAARIAGFEGGALTGMNLRQAPSFIVCKDITVLHNHMVTSKTMGNFKQKQDLVNWIRLIRKHPNLFPFSLRLVIERLRNFSGYIKVTFSQGKPSLPK